MPKRIPPIVDSSDIQENELLLTSDQIKVVEEYFKKNPTKQKLSRKKSGELRLPLPVSVIKTSEGRLIALYRGKEHKGKERYLGEGGAGQVKIAQDLYSKNWLAFKRKRRNKEEGEALDSEQERRILEKLGKLHARTVISNKNNPGMEKEYIFMAYSFGRDMLNTLVEVDKKDREKNIRKKHSLEDRISMALGVTEALFETHEKNIIHRDIKLDNFMWDPEITQAELIDYGESEVLGLDVDKLITKTGVGTPAYMAPESGRSKGGKEFSKKSDAYGLGVVLGKIFQEEAAPNVQIKGWKEKFSKDYLDAHGKTINRDSPEKFISEFLTDKPEILEKYTPEKRKQCELIKGLMHPQPSQRLSTADAFCLLFEMKLQKELKFMVDKNPNETILKNALRKIETMPSDISLADRMQKLNGILTALKHDAVIFRKFSEKTQNLINRGMVNTESWLKEEIYFKKLKENYASPKLSVKNIFFFSSEKEYKERVTNIVKQWQAIIIDKPLKERQFYIEKMQQHIANVKPRGFLERIAVPKSAIFELDEKEINLQVNLVENKINYPYNKGFFGLQRKYEKLTVHFQKGEPKVNHTEAITHHFSSDFKNKTREKKKNANSKNMDNSLTPITAELEKPKHR